MGEHLTLFVLHGVAFWAGYMATVVFVGRLLEWFQGRKHRHGGRW
jgi:hypothetical protein